MDAFELFPNTQQIHYKMIVSFTKLDMIIEPKTRDKFNRVKLHNDVKFSLPPKTCVMLKE